MRERDARVRRDGEGRLSIRSAYDTMDRLIEQLKNNKIIPQY